MYSESQTPSRPARGAHRPPRWRRTLTWLIAVCAFAAAAVYVVGGREFVRRILQVRSRATAVLQPPTQAEMQRATQSAVGATASQTDANLPKPASLGMMAIWTATILLIVLVLFVVTAWYPRRRDGD